jgi:hypothetical protein
VEAGDRLAAAPAPDGADRAAMARVFAAWADGRTLIPA